MSTVEAPEALPIVRAAIFQVLSPIVLTDDEGLPRAYWRSSPETAERPKIVFQSQDHGGRREPYIGGCGWSGLFAIKSYGITDDQADQLSIDAHAAMQGITPPAGYSLDILEAAPLDLAAGAPVAAVVYRLALYKTPS